MAEEERLPPTAVGDLPATMRQLLEERAAKREAAVRKAKKADATERKIAAQASAAPQRADDLGSLALPEQVTRVANLVRRDYLALLCEPEVIANVRSILTGKDAKAVRDLFTVVRELVAGETFAGTGGGVRVTVVNRVPRPAGSPTIDVTPNG